MTYVGADFSSWQGNLPTSGLEHLDFAYVKLTQGDNYSNPNAPQQVAALRGQGVEVGFYHFFEPTAEVGQQLLLFSRMAAACGGTKLPLALDSETSDATGWAALAVKMTKFALGVESWTNYVPNPRSLLYVNVSYYTGLPGFPWGRWVWLADPSPAPRKPCLIWQSGQRPLGGSALTNVDWDQFMGSEADWQAFTGQQVTAQAPTTAPQPAPPAPPPPPPPPVAPRFPGRLLELHGRPYEEGSDVRAWQAQMVHRGWPLLADGVYGPATAAICLSFQSQKHLTVDGIVGPATWAAAWTAPITP